MKQSITESIFKTNGIDIDLVRTSPLNNDFICVICQSLAWTPTSCKTCSSLFCKNCINLWMERSKTCPQCKKNFIREKVNRMIKNILNEYEIECPMDCGIVVKYELLVKHLSTECKNGGQEAIKMHIPTKQEGATPGKPISFMEGMLRTGANVLGILERLVPRTEEEVKGPPVSTTPQIHNMTCNICSKSLHVKWYASHEKYCAAKYPTTIPPYNKSLADTRRNKHLTHQLTENIKMLLFKTAVEGDPHKMATIVEQRYPLLEECSKRGHYWTIFHYLSHYGRDQALKIVLAKIPDDPIVRKEIINLQTFDGKTALMIGLSSQECAPEAKYEIIKIWIGSGLVDYDLRTEKNESLIDIAQYSHLQHYLQSLIYQTQQRILLTNSLNKTQKLEMYKAITGRNLLIFSSLIEIKGWSILEECSKQGFYWNVLHYAAHFGLEEILKYVLDELRNHPDLFQICNIQTIEGKSPVICALTSAEINTQTKQLIYDIFKDRNLVDTRVMDGSHRNVIQLAHGFHINT